MFPCCKKKSHNVVINKLLTKDDPPDFLDEKTAKIFLYSQKGYGKSKEECQDTYCIMNKFQFDITYVAIYDGHGVTGRMASRLANMLIQQMLIKNASKIKKYKEDCSLGNIMIEIHTFQRFFSQEFVKMQEVYHTGSVDFSQSGTCVIGILIIDDLILSINLGDSRAVIGNIENKSSKDCTISALEISIDHKPSRDVEKARILKAGGRIEKVSIYGQEKGLERVWKADSEGFGIAISRSLGDLMAHNIGITCIPEVTFKYKEESDIFIVLGSDGVWDVMTSAEAICYVNDFKKENVAKGIVDECRGRWELQNKIIAERERIACANSGMGESKIKEKMSLLAMSMECDDITLIVIYL